MEARGVGPRTAIVICARNEAQSIRASISSAKTPGASVYVLADNCSDSTAACAFEAGAKVLERCDADRLGKGHALAWLMGHGAHMFGQFERIIILDADSRVDAGFMRAIETAFAKGALVVQAFVRPVGASQSPASALAAYSELLSQLMGDRIRSWLGWSVQLRGTGMAFRPEVLREVVAGLSTRVEDVELTLRLARRGIRIHWVPEAVVYDPKPPDAGRVSRQRARWLQGQVEVWRAYWRDILALALRGGPNAWSLLWAVLAKPKTLLSAVKVLLLALAIALPVGGQVRVAIRAALGLSVAVDFTYYLIGLLLVEERGMYARSLLAAPLYLLVWLRSVALGLRSKDAWLRARD